MSIFRKSAGLERSSARYKIKVTTRDGRVFYWHKRGQLHTVEEDVAIIFVANFKPELFQVRDDGTLGPPGPETFPIERVEKEPV